MDFEEILLKNAAPSPTKQILGDGPGNEEVQPRETIWKKNINYPETCPEKQRGEERRAENSRVNDWNRGKTAEIAQINEMLGEEMSQKNEQNGKETLEAHPKKDPTNETNAGWQVERITNVEEKDNSNSSKPHSSVMELDHLDPITRSAEPSSNFVAAVSSSEQKSSASNQPFNQATPVSSESEILKQKERTKRKNNIDGDRQPQPSGSNSTTIAKSMEEKRSEQRVEPADGLVVLGRRIPTDKRPPKVRAQSISSSTPTEGGEIESGNHMGEKNDKAASSQQTQQSSKRVQSSASSISRSMSARHPPSHQSSFSNRNNAALESSLLSAEGGNIDQTQPRKAHSRPDLTGIRHEIHSHSRGISRNDPGKQRTHRKEAVFGLVQSRSSSGGLRKLRLHFDHDLPPPTTEVIYPDYLKITERRNTEASKEYPTGQSNTSNQQPLERNGAPTKSHNKAASAAESLRDRPSVPQSQFVDQRGNDWTVSHDSSNNTTSGTAVTDTESHHKSDRNGNIRPKVLKEEEQGQVKPTSNQSMTRGNSLADADMGGDGEQPRREEVPLEAGGRDEPGVPVGQAEGQEREGTRRRLRRLPRGLRHHSLPAVPQPPPPTRSHLEGEGGVEEVNRSYAGTPPPVFLTPSASFCHREERGKQHKKGGGDFLQSPSTNMPKHSLQHSIQDSLGRYAARFFRGGASAPVSSGPDPAHPPSLPLSNVRPDQTPPQDPPLASGIPAGHSANNSLSRQEKTAALKAQTASQSAQSTSAPSGGSGAARVSASGATAAESPQTGADRGKSNPHHVDTNRLSDRPERVPDESGLVNPTNASSSKPPLPTTGSNPHFVANSTSMPPDTPKLSHRIRFIGAPRGDSFENQSGGDSQQSDFDFINHRPPRQSPSFASKLSKSFADLTSGERLRNWKSRLPSVRGKQGQTDKRDKSKERLHDPGHAPANDILITNWHVNPLSGVQLPIPPPQISHLSKQQSAGVGSAGPRRGEPITFSSAFSFPTERLGGHQPPHSGQPGNHGDHLSNQGNHPSNLGNHHPATKGITGVQGEKSRTEPRAMYRYPIPSPQHSGPYNRTMVEDPYDLAGGHWETNDGDKSTRVANNPPPLYSSSTGERKRLPTAENSFATALWGLQQSTHELSSVSFGSASGERRVRGAGGGEGLRGEGGSQTIAGVSHLFQLRQHKNSKSWESAHLNSKYRHSIGGLLDTQMDHRNKKFSQDPTRIYEEINLPWTGSLGVVDSIGYGNDEIRPDDRYFYYQRQNSQSSVPPPAPSGGSSSKQQQRYDPPVSKYDVPPSYDGEKSFNSLPPPARITPYSGVPHGRDGDIIRPIAFKPVVRHADSLKNSSNPVQPPAFGYLSSPEPSGHRRQSDFEVYSDTSSSIYGVRPNSKSHSHAFTPPNRYVSDSEVPIRQQNQYQTSASTGSANHHSGSGHPNQGAFTNHRGAYASDSESRYLAANTAYSSYGVRSDDASAPTSAYSSPGLVHRGKPGGAYRTPPNSSAGRYDIKNEPTYSNISRGQMIGQTDSINSDYDLVPEFIDFHRQHQQSQQQHTQQQNKSGSLTKPHKFPADIFGDTFQPISHQPQQLTSTSRTSPVYNKFPNNTASCNIGSMPGYIGGQGSSQSQGGPVHTHQNQMHIPSGSPGHHHGLGSAHSNQSSGNRKSSETHSQHSHPGGGGPNMSGGTSHSTPGSLGSRQSSGIHVTPSPSDSGVAELEAALRERESELTTLRSTMEANEQIIVRVYQEKEDKWQEKLREWSNRLESSIQTEQKLLARIQDLQDERAHLQRQIQNMNAERHGLQRKCKDLEKEVFSIQERLDTNEKHWAICRQCGDIFLPDKNKLNNDSNANHCNGVIENNSTDSTEPTPISPQGHLHNNPNPHLQTKSPTPNDDLRLEIDTLRKEVFGLKDSLQQQINSYSQERVRWDQEKQKVVQYQKVLQANYVQVFERNQELEQLLEKNKIEPGSDTERMPVSPLSLPRTSPLPPLLANSSAPHILPLPLPDHHLQRLNGENNQQQQQEEGTLKTDV